MSGRDSIQDSTTAPTMRMSRLTTAITSQAGSWPASPSVT